jgi:hypothetical protein
MVWCPNGKATPVPEVTRYRLGQVLLLSHECCWGTESGLGMGVGRKDGIGFEPLDRE